MMLITPPICWQAHFPILAEVVARIFAGDAFASLDLLLCPFFFRHRGFCADPLGVLRVSLLLNDCPASWCPPSLVSEP